MIYSVRELREDSMYLSVFGILDGGGQLNTLHLTLRPTGNVDLITVRYRVLQKEPILKIILSLGLGVIFGNTSRKGGPPI